MQRENLSTIDNRFCIYLTVYTIMANTVTAFYTVQTFNGTDKSPRAVCAAIKKKKKT